MKRKVIATLLALALLSCSALAAITIVDMGRAWGFRAACTLDASSSRELSLLTALYPDIGWTAYAQSAQREVICDALPTRKAEAAVLSFLGTTERIAFFPVMSGRLPLDGEQDVCALDKDTAFRLFGSIDPGEDVIRLGEKLVRVIGVIDIDRPLLLVPAEPDGVFDRLVADDRDALLMLMTTLDVESDPFELSGAELAGFAELLCALPWLMVAMLVLVALRKKGKGWQVAVTALIWALMLGTFLMMLMRVPVRLLPARWSDFTFYTEQLAAWKVQPFRVPDVRDGLLGADMMRVRLLSAMACIALWMERMWLRCGNFH